MSALLTHDPAQKGDRLLGYEDRLPGRGRRWTAQGFERHFWSRVNKGGPNGCWLWMGSKRGKGYGSTYSPLTGGTKQSHRIAYILTRGPIPDGLALDHLCCNPSCVNPDHLDPCTVIENIKRAAQRRTACRNGHPRTPENTSIRTGRGRRFATCRICLRASEARQRQNRRSK